MKIKLEYNMITVTIEARENPKSFDACTDALQLASTVISKSYELKYGKPRFKITMDAEQE